MRERSRVTTARRQFNDAVNAGNREAGETALKTYSSVLDKAVKHSIMNRNTAIRRKRRAANRMRALAS
jgi:ribosomal protein S20